MATQIVNGNTEMGPSGANHCSGVVPDPGATAGTNRFLREDASFEDAVQSISLNVPAEFTVSGSPVTTSGTITIGKATENANTVWAGPASGSPAVPAFRQLSSADLSDSSNIAFLNAANVFSSGVQTVQNIAIAAGTTAATATAGSATLPANPVGFLEISFNSILIKIPYYSV